MLTRRLDANHDMQFGRGLADFARDAEATAQAVKTRLQLLQGEWFLDTAAGVPYLQSIMVKPVALPFVEATLKQTILDTEGVEELRTFSMTLDRETRRAAIACTVRTAYDDLTNIKVMQ